MALKILCVNAGNYCGRGKEYVEILYDMVKRNLRDNIEGEFICFTDDKEPYCEGITKRPLARGIHGWYNKLYLFKNGLFDEGDRLVFMDLDTVIVGGIDHIVSYNGSFATLRDFWRPAGLGPAIMLWEANTANIWDWWHQHGCPMHGNGDQTVIENWAKDQYVLILQDLFPNDFVSFKTHAQFCIPEYSKIVCFHGHPRPHEVENSWVNDIWKIGGGTTLDLRMLGNAPVELIKSNIENAAQLPHEVLVTDYMAPNEKDLLIIGGGPSLKGDILEIKYRQQNGAIVWALNNTFKYLINNDIYPDAHILLDGRLENAEFVPESTVATLLYACQCHPETFKKAEKSGGKIIIWYPTIDGILDIMDEHRITAALIEGGTTTGMKAFGLAKLFGFKKLHLYGYDSSYDEDENHAYPQPLNDGERVIEVTCNDKKFKCAAWMACQVQEFKASINGFLKWGFEIQVHGSGLLPYIASLLANNE